MPIECTCQICGKKFRVPPSRIKNGWGIYCSRQCTGKANSEHLRGNKHAAGSGGNSASFKKGHIPWNKGLKGIHLSPETEYKPNRKNENKAPLGATSIRKDRGGNLRRWVKISDDPDKWIEFARMVWMEHFGSVPDGAVVHHVDRNTLNDNIDNLQVMTRAEHLTEHRDEIRASFQEQS